MAQITAVESVAVITTDLPFAEFEVGVDQAAARFPQHTLSGGCHIKKPVMETFIPGNYLINHTYSADTPYLLLLS